MEGEKPCAEPAPPPATPPAMSKPAPSPAPHRCQGLRRLPSLMASNWKGLLVLSIFIVMGALSGTVLKRPVERAAGWLRERGDEGYALFGAVGYVLIMVGGSTTVFEILAGFVYGLKSGFIISFLVKLCVAVSSFAIARHVLRDWLRRRLLDRYVYLAAAAELIREKPWVSVLLIRASALPTIVKNYGMGSLGAKWVPFIATASLTFALKSYVLVDLGSNLQNPREIFGARNEKTQALEYSALAACLLAIGMGFYYGRKYAKKIKAQRALGDDAVDVEVGVEVGPRTRGLEEKDSE